MRRRPALLVLVGLTVAVSSAPAGAVPEVVDTPQGRVAGPAYLAGQYGRLADQHQHEDYQARLGQERAQCPAGHACQDADPYVAAWSRENLRQERGVLPTAPVAYELLMPQEGARSPVDGRPLRAPYPAVLLLPGGATPKEVYRGVAQGLAAAGHAVLSVDPECNLPCSAPTTEQQLGGLASVLTTVVVPIVGSCLTTGCDYSGLAQAYVDSERSYQAAGRAGLQFLADHRPRLVDRHRVGVVGHSLGAYNAAVLAQRVDLALPVRAAVAWDGYGLLAADLPLRVPVQFQAYEGQDLSPHPFRPEETPSHGNARRLQAAGVPTGVVALRSSAHYEVGHVPYDVATVQGMGASRKGERVALEATAAWLGAFLGTGRVGADAREALLSPVLSDAVDAVAHGQGTEAADGSNVPYAVGGEARAAHLSLLLRSWYDLADGTRCEDLVAGCG